MQVGKAVSMGLPETSMCASVAVPPKTLLCNLAERHPRSFRSDAFRLKRFHIPFQKTAVPGDETKRRVYLDKKVL